MEKSIEKSMEENMENSKENSTENRTGENMENRMKKNAEKHSEISMGNNTEENTRKSNETKDVCDAHDDALQRNRFKFNPQPKWTTEDDLQQNAEEARIWAVKIFSFIKYLAQGGCKVKYFWNKRKPVEDIMDWARVGLGEAEYISDICDSALAKLKKDAFYDQ